MMLEFIFVPFLWISFTLINAQQLTPAATTYLHNGLSLNIGNFSLELLNRTAVVINPNQNMIMSPITVWTLLAVITEGADHETRNELRIAARIPPNRIRTRNEFKHIYNYLAVNTSTVELSKMNAVFTNIGGEIEKDYLDIIANIYDTRLIPVDFRNGELAAKNINAFVSHVTNHRIKSLVEKSNFENTKMILVSAVYFKGQWAAPFNISSTEKMPFYDNDGRQIGFVNMMYNRFTYPFANIRSLKARVIELPYGKEDRLSMLVMLPHFNVTVEDMFVNFGTVPLDTLFQELRVSRENYGDDEVECFLPRFKIESNLKLRPVLESMGVDRVFDEWKAQLPWMARSPLHVSSIIHKAEIEVTEQGTVASAVSGAEFANRIGGVRFEANRPFAYVIIEKITNTIVFGGFYQQPSLY